MASLLGLLPVRLASRAFTRVFMNPGGAPSDDELRNAVEGKVVLVTGASYGIGEATALKVGHAGAEVLLVARSADRLSELASHIEELGGTAHVHACDLTDAEQIENLAAEILREHGYVDIVVSNAGKSIRRSIELSYERPQDFERTMDINYLGPVRLLLSLLPAMTARGEGQIVNVSTLGVRVGPQPRWAAYLASKSAFDLWLRSVAPEIRRQGVACTSIYFGLVHTRMSAPTPMFRSMPGLTPEQAADLVARAIVERPRAITPWWVTMTEPFLGIAAGPWERAMSLYTRFTPDSPASTRAAERSDVPDS